MEVNSYEMFVILITTNLVVGQLLVAYSSIDFSSSPLKKLGKFDH